MSLFWKREREARQLIERYFMACDEAMGQFERAIDVYLTEGDSDAFSALDERVRACESEADRLRNEAERLLYRRTLLPESRGDLLGLLEAFDRMPNLAETVTFMLYTQRIVIPEAFRERFRQLVQSSLGAYRLVREVVDLLLSQPDDVDARVPLVSAKETAADDLERAFIHDVFRSDLEKADMILLRQLVGRVGGIADSAERVARRVDILSFKRRI
jgi:uncharacterized protein